jgi:hypothetical protein
MWAKVFTFPLDIPVKKGLDPQFTERVSDKLFIVSHLAAVRAASRGRYSRQDVAG